MKHLHLQLLHTPSFPIPVAFHHRMFFYDVPLIVLVSWLSFKFYEHPVTLWGKQRADGAVRSEEVARGQGEVEPWRASATRTEIKET